MIPFLPAIAPARGLPWKAIACGAAVIGIFFAGATVNGLRWQSRYDARETELATQRTKLVEEYREREHVLQEALAIVDTERTAERTKAREENDTLRGRVDAGAIRLRVRAACPSAKVPNHPADPSMDQGTSTELAADARPDYFALRGGLRNLETALNACQDILDVFGKKQ